jgi:CRP/FNR family transcriptional regulator, cyclic AMP receptor protein
MFERFQGREGRVALINALRSQFLVDGNSEIADRIASAAQIKEFAPGGRLFAQGERGTDVFFVLAGKVSVRVGEREVATCGTGMHVGEMALLDPFAGRSATVQAIDTVATGSISAQKFTEIANSHPQLWRRVAIELARRLVRLEIAAHQTAAHQQVVEAATA